jgi:transcription elongation factor Elf1
MISSFIETDLNEVKNYYDVSRCKKCGRDFAYEEIEKPLIKKIITYGNYEETVTRYFKCKYCNDEDLRIKTFI